MAKARKNITTASNEEAVEGFVLKPYHKPVYAIVAISKRENILFNRWSEELNHPFEQGKKLPVADQATLKRVYDAGAEFQDWITPPDGYEAAWAK